MDNNKRTMEYLGKDNFDMPVYKCLETERLWKDINLGKGKPDLYSCGNEVDGDPDRPIKTGFDISFINAPEKVTREEEFTYQMLDRLRTDCEYYLGFGSRSVKNLWAHDEQTQIDEMKSLWNKLGVKPEWLSFEQILEYEKQMVPVLPV